jgi:hypothetical protein
MAYVYRHIRKDLNVPFYIGVSIRDDDKYKRAYEDHAGRRNKEWYDIVKLTDYEVDILMDSISLEKAHEKEQEFVRLYGRIDIGTGTLINKTDGGKGCVNGITPETREKMAAKLRGRPQPKWQRDILSKAAMGKKVPWRHVAIIEVDKNNNIIKEFESIAAAAKEYGLQVANVHKVINGQRSHTKGYVFKYK